MDALVEADLFPATQHYTYLNAASVAPMSRMAAKATLDWQEDLALRGSFLSAMFAAQAIICTATGRIGAVRGPIFRVRKMITPLFFD